MLVIVVTTLDYTIAMQGSTRPPGMEPAGPCSESRHKPVDRAPAGSRNDAFTARNTRRR